MCEHCNHCKISNENMHKHGCGNECQNDENCNENEKLQLVRIITSVILVVIAVIFKPVGLVKILIYFAAYLISGADILYKAFMHLFKGNLFDENFLMSIATVGAFAIGEFPEAVMVMVLYQIGETLQDRAVDKSKKSVEKLMDIRPDYANVLINGELIKKNPVDVKTGDVIRIKAGEKIPLDGTVIEGSAAVDTSALTGESVPRTVNVGDKAISGCINTNGLLTVKVEKEFGQSAVSKILELVEHASSKKAKAENFITKFAKYYTPAVVFGAVALAFVPPLLIKGAVFNVWFQRALTFLVISCPCALVISVPLGFFAGIGGASKKGILVKGACYMEALSKPYAVVFDKTGTLTKGVFCVTSINPVDGESSENLLKAAAYTENYSTHPIAVSLKKAYEKEINTSLIKNVCEIAGNGVTADINGVETAVGNLKLMHNKYDLNIEPVKSAGTTVYVAVNGKYAGYITISDELKPDSKSTIAALNKFVPQTVMLTGDSSSAAEFVSKEIGIKSVYSELLPNQKVEKLEDLINKRKGSVIFVGDGINDAPVLTRADVGIAMGGLGSDAAIEAADAVIMDDKPSNVVKAVFIAKKTMKIVKENIVFALGIKGLFLVLGGFGIITMWGAVFADVGVTLIAVLNSMRALK